NAHPRSATCGPGPTRGRQCSGGCRHPERGTKFVTCSEMASYKLAATDDFRSCDVAITAKRVESYRARCEDRAEIIGLDDVTILVVADGAGGRPGGAEAAEMVIRVVRDALTGTPRCYDPRFWCGVLRQADEQVLADPQAGETTAVVLA